MLEPPELSLEILEWLSALRLTQYTSFFHHSGYRSLEDCKDLTDERLLQLNVLPTGHRRRILRSLEDQGLKQKSGEEVEAEEDVEGKMGEKKPALHPRHVFLKDRNKGMAYPHNQTKETMEYDLQGMAADEEKLPESRNVLPPVPAPRNLQSIRTPASAQTNMPSHRTSSSSESPPNSDAPSDIEVSSEEHLPELAEDHEGFHCEMVDNSIYESQPCAGLKPTRSYRLRHRPVPEIPSQTTASVQDRSAQTSNPEHLTGSERPIGADGSQKALLQRTSTPIAPYGETFLYNNPERTLEQAAKEGLPKTFKAKMRQKKKRRKSMECSSVLFDPDVAEYSTVDECASMVPRIGLDQTSALNPDTAAVGPQLFVSKDASVIEMVECGLYSQHADARGAITKSAQPDISPYACFYGAPKQQVLKVGWLDKLSPQGKCVFQRRWVRFDGESLAYFNNDKEMYSKGMVLASAIRQVRGLGDNKFEVVTSLRTFVFRAEKEGERQEWMEILQTATHPPACSSQKCSDNLLLLSSANKRGLLELRGYKGRVLASLVGSKVRLSKTEQDYRAGLGIAEVELAAATIRDVDRRSFEINTPFKNFCFVADSEREKGEWIEAVQESITETLYDYEVAEKIWFNKANRSCADCRAPRPEWAAVNLGVVICKKCAGQHRSLGPSLSKVRSLKLDTSVWSNELVELFLEVGNKSANDFWAANLPMEQELHSAATTEERATFIRRKYRERKYMKVLEGFHDLEQLNKALCAAVVTPDTLQTMMLVFSGADVMCATGDQTFSTPYLLAQHAGQKLQMEFLHHNKLSDFPKLEHLLENTSLSSASQFMDGFLYISTGPTKATLDRRGKDDMVRRWCTLEGGFLSYYESERSTLAIGRVDVTEVVSLAINNSETMTGAGAVFTVELFLQTERALIVGAGTQATQHDWIQALTKCFVPSKVEGLVRRSSELIGRLYSKEGHDLYHWRMGWFMLEGSVLHFNLGDDEGEDEVLQLKQLQELTVSTHTEGEDKIQVLLMVECGRTLYIHGFNKLDFSLWHSAISLAAGTNGKALSDQQLTKNGVPIIVDSCIAFVTQYGLCLEGVYQRPGDPARVSHLLVEFTRDARNVKLREKDHQVEDVTNTLKSFLSQAEDALLTKELYPYWVSALDEKDERRRVEKYFTFIQSLPKINRSTLEALLQHLYRIQQCSHLNQMQSEKLASVFSSCLFQTRGPTPQEISVVLDLINNYITLFNVNEDQVQQMERENSFITRWNEKKDTSFCPAGDLIFEVYLEKRVPEQCCLIKVHPSMRPQELAETALNMKNGAFKADDFWTTFEVIENGELERPLHHCEKILEQVLEWSTLDSPGSAFLLMKKFPEAKIMTNSKDLNQSIKGDYLKFSDGSSKLLSGHKFQDKYVVLRAEKLLLYRDIKNTKAEKAIQLTTVKCFLGLKKKLKPPTNWGFTVCTDKHQWHFCCDTKETQVSWVTNIIAMKFGSDLLSKGVESKEAAVVVSRGGAISESTKVPLYNHCSNKPVLPQLLNRTVSLGDGEPKAAKFSGVQPKTRTLPMCPQPSDLFSTPEATHRRIPSDVCLPHKPPSPSWPRHSQATSIPVSPQMCQKTPGKRPPPCGEGLMPASLLNELNTVLNKTGRKKND